MVCIILLPLWIYQRDGLRVKGAAPFSFYFSALGLAFMIVEISLMQKCVLILGNPMYSIPVLLATILIAAGLGSGVGARWQARFSHKVLVSTAIAVVTLAAAAAFLTWMAPTLLQFGFLWRAAITALASVPTAFFMGMFFPAGLQAVREQAPEFVPWAWGINGCASVYGSVAAIILAMWHGFNFVLGVGMFVYLLAAISVWLIPASEERAADLVERALRAETVVV